ncbi:Acylpyruvase FAHD1 mitochondrial [Fasciola gigantica]|uniref:oxaloacetate tautomerase n=1 Tax=Fasciola gigantica TaxID=46835 RepID=A0A504YCY8_FASGI|nr:Acylpyruvase FAHD1 mitochondrial [Fasciola gigantica]
MTDRARQNRLKSLQLPWTLAKCFDTSCPVGPVLPSSLLPSNLFLEQPNPQGQTLGLWLQVNGQERQRGSVVCMIHSPVRLISFISHCMRLEPGDLILTGTPAGVGPVRAGDVIRVGIDQLCDVEFPVI